MKEWIQLRKKQIGFICALLFAEALPLFVPDLLPPKGGWASYTTAVLIFGAIIALMEKFLINPKK